MLAGRLNREVVSALLGSFFLANGNVLGGLGGSLLPGLLQGVGHIIALDVHRAHPLRGWCEFVDFERLHR